MVELNDDLEVRERLMVKYIFDMFKDNKEKYTEREVDLLKKMAKFIIDNYDLFDSIEKSAFEDLIEIKGYTLGDEDYEEPDYRPFYDYSICKNESKFSYYDNALGR